MRISDWSSDVCSSDLLPANHHIASRIDPVNLDNALRKIDPKPDSLSHGRPPSVGCYTPSMARLMPSGRSEEHTSELQSLMRISYAVFCLKKKNKQKNYYNSM